VEELAKKLHPAAELAACKIEKSKSAAVEELNDRSLRLAAEFDNYKKRTARQFAEIVKNANEELIQELLGVIDDFDRAMQTASEAEKQGQENSRETFLKGIQLIYDKLGSVLKGRGVERFEPVGQPFDPQYHDAVMQLPSDKDEGTVVGVISPGYTLNDKVIRHAKVIVASSK
jgi:molecular chaperone GrpE